MSGESQQQSNWADRIAESLAEIPEDEYQLFLGCCRKVRDEGWPADENGESDGI